METSRKFMVVAHRGDKAHAPENTFRSFELAVAAKADAIETDVRLTRDGVPVLLHDASLKRTAGLDKPVEQVSWDEIRKLDRGIPRLDEFVETFLPRIPLQIEIKAEAATLPTVEILRRGGAFDRVLLTSFESRFLRAAKQAEPRLVTGWLLSHDSSATVEDVKTLGCAFVNPNSDHVNEAWVGRAHAAGLKVCAWGVDNLEIAARVVKAGADGATYDDPAALLSLLRC